MQIEKAISFLKGLSHRTSQGDVQWKKIPNSAPEIFYIEVKDVQISLGLRYTDDNFDEVDYYINFSSAHDDEFIYQFTDADLRPAFPQAYRVMEGLYRDARLVATGLKQQLDSALDEFIKADPDSPF
ncbi:hypothetical protein [Ralstonia sp. ASV6]|uniref:hypothetical protein n=1 Tax=Ralstonia sp. ASV6 TaxID=2795124 RepID=UPI0018ED6DB8|nr:hypothetical protein [Ralstonia sp. ASV6]